MSVKKYPEPKSKQNQVYRLEDQRAEEVPEENPSQGQKYSPSLGNWQNPGIRLELPRLTEQTGESKTLESKGRNRSESET